MRLHLDLKTEENLAAGMTLEEARRRSHVRFGNSAKIQEASREVYMIRQAEILVQDLRYACRTIRRSPGFAAVVVLSMALGIGANAAIFNLINTLMLRSLPVQDPQQLVILANDKSWSFSSPILQTVVSRLFSYPAYTEFRHNNHVFSGVLAVRDIDRISAIVDGQSDLVSGLFASGNYYSVLGVNSLTGRPLTPDDDRTGGASSVAVISYDYWQRRFGRDPAVLNKTIYLNGKPFSVIGVTPAGFYGLDVASSPPDVTLPMTMQDAIAGE
ncbi:MAG: ABC transporter permease, partial [Blastocatellia bacterium]